MANEAPFPVDPVLTGIAVAYRNPGYIADAVLPRVPVGKKAFKYWTYPIAETLAVLNTRVGRKGRPAEVDLSATETTASVEDFGLDDPIPQDDIANAPMDHKPVDRAVAQLAEHIAIDRERRSADLVFTAANYPSGQKVQLSGTSQWSDYTNSLPVGDIQAGIDACVMRPNIAVMGQQVWTKLRQHPKVVQAVFGPLATGGLVTREQFAAAFELDEVLVGQGWYNSAKKGQTATLTRLWGKHFLLAYRNRQADTQNGITYGFTAEFGGRIAGVSPDPNIGLRGGQRARVGESVKELLIATLAAYFVQDAVA